MKKNYKYKFSSFAILPYLYCVVTVSTSWWDKGNADYMAYNHDLESKVLRFF